MTRSNLITQSDLLGKMTAEELWRQCRKATSVAVRAPYTADDRAECAADCYGAIVAEIMAERPSGARTGRPRDVLAYIDLVLASGAARETAALPTRHDRRVQFVALRNRAADWRRARDRQRERDSLALGKRGATRQRTSADDVLPARYLAAGARQTQNRAMAATREACQLLGLPHGRDVQRTVARTAMISETVTVHEHSAAYCALYAWVRDVAPETAAAELGLTWENYRQRASRAGKVIRASATAADVLTALCGAPIIAGMRTAAETAATGKHGRAAVLAYIGAALAAAETGELQFALTDASRDAHGRTPIMAPDPRDGTNGGDWPTRPETARQAADACKVTKRRPAPQTAAQNRTRALNGRDASEAEADARSALGRALGRDGQTHAGTGLRASANGRTSGKPMERYAPRAVRLGNR